MSFERFIEAVQRDPLFAVEGRVLKVHPAAVRAKIPNAKVGSLCQAVTGGRSIPLEVVSLDPEGHVAMPLDDLRGIELGARVTVSEESSTIPVGESLLGNVVDSMCLSYENRKLLKLPDRALLYGNPVNPLGREIIREPIDLGIRSVNACLTCGRGQRQGIFAGSGVGKSVLLGMIARHTAADVVVIGLVGERGREVREFIEKDLGKEGLKKAVVVVETADKSAVRRSRGAYVATAVSEYFCRKGANVLLLMDSLTRFAMAQREIGIAAGEPPTTKGYTPSVFTSLSRLVERAGNWGNRGSITGLYSVLVEGDDMDDPVADNTRAFLDGHVILSRKMANRGYYPAVDILSSVSRVMDQIVDPNQLRVARTIKEIMSRYQDNEDAINIGMYSRGTDALIDECIEMAPRVTEFLKQDRNDAASFEQSKQALLELME